MTSRERMLTALKHQEPDRIPLDLASTQVTGISSVAYTNLLKFLDVPAGQPQVCDEIQQICIPDDTIMQKFGVDTRGLWPLTYSNHGINNIDDGEYLSHTNEWGLKYRIKKGGAHWYDLYESPMAAATITVPEIEEHNWPDGGAKYRFEGIREQALKYREQGYVVVLKSLCAGLLEMAIRLRGMENCLIDMMVNQEGAGKLLDCILRVKLDYWESAFQELGDVVDILAEADDFGTQTSQLISPGMFREIVRPRQAELIGFMKSRAPQASVFFHSCGSIRALLPDFIEMGIDIINPVHIRAAGMEPKQLKQDFGNDITFWGGGIDTQDTLPHGTPDQVRDEVKMNIDALAPGGGFVFNTIHNIQADVPPENILALYETLQEYGSY